MFLRPARSEESALLTEVAREAKASWGYPEAWLRHWASELTITESYLERHTVLVAELEGDVAGFVAVELGDARAEIAHLWVRPRHHGRGVGRAVVEAATAHAAEAGVDRLEVVSDPHAEGFYRRMGGRRTGWVDATFEGVERRLPVLRLPTGGC